jgi:hypothetical protein
MNHSSRILMIACALIACLMGVPINNIQNASAAAAMIITPQQRYALVIGINGNASIGGKESVLKYADRDAIEFAAFIKTERGGAFPHNHVHLLTNDATRDKIFAEFKWLYQTAGPNDLVYVFFAGHGVEYENESYFLPINVTADNLESQAIPMSVFFKKVTRDLSAKQIVLFIDACHAAAAEQGVRGPSSTDIQKEWDRLNDKEGQLDMAFFSSLAYQKSWEDSELGGGHGLFTWYLLEGLRGEAPSSSEGWITASNILDYVKQKVEARSQSKFSSRQTPSGSPSFRTDFTLALSTAQPSAAYSNEGRLVGVIEISSVNRGSIYIDGKEMGQIFENGKKIFQRQAMGKHQVLFKGADVQSTEVNVENGAVAYANFGIKNPIDETHEKPVGSLHLGSERGLSGEVYIDNYRVGHLEPGGQVTIRNLIAGNHTYSVVDSNGTKTEGPAYITPNVTTSLMLAAPTNLRVVTP